MGGACRFGHGVGGFKTWFNSFEGARALGRTPISLPRVRKPAKTCLLVFCRKLFKMMMINKSNPGSVPVARPHRPTSAEINQPAILFLECRGQGSAASSQVIYLKKGRRWAPPKTHTHKRGRVVLFFFAGRKTTHSAVPMFLKREETQRGVPPRSSGASAGLVQG